MDKRRAAEGGGESRVQGKTRTEVEDQKNEFFSYKLKLRSPGRQEGKKQENTGRKPKREDALAIKNHETAGDAKRGGRRCNKEEGKWRAVEEEKRKR